MVGYLINSMLCMALLSGFYFLFLEKKNNHQLKRHFLLGTLLFSAIIPGIELRVEHEITNLSSFTSTLSASESFVQVLTGIYLCGLLLLLVKFIATLYTIYRKVSAHKKIFNKKATIVLLKEEVLPHTFLHYVFVNEDQYDHGSIEEELFTHEYAHVKEKHSIDILFMELFQIVFWFNPMIVFIKKAIRLNHEYIADNKVVEHHRDSVSYQEILLNIATWKSTNALVSNVNYSVTKKRFTMMKKDKTNPMDSWVKLAIVPLVALLFFLFSQITTGGEEHHGSEHATSVEQSTVSYL